MDEQGQGLAWLGLFGRMGWNNWSLDGKLGNIDCTDDEYLFH